LVAAEPLPPEVLPPVRPVVPLRAQAPPERQAQGPALPAPERLALD